MEDTECFLTVKQAQNALSILAHQVFIPDHLLEKTNQLFELYSKPYNFSNRKRINCFLFEEEKQVKRT